MSHKLSLAAVVLPLLCLCAHAVEEKEIVGEWEGKSKKGKVVGLEFKADKTMTTLEDGKPDMPPGATAKWELVDGAKGHLDFVLKMGADEMRLPMLLEVADGKIKLAPPKEDGKRLATMAEADDAIEFSKKAAGGGGEANIAGKWEGKNKDEEVIGLELKDDKTLLNTKDGENIIPEGATAKWELVDAAKGHLDFILTIEGKELRVPMIMELKDGKLKIGGPKEDGKRPTSMAESDDPVEFSKK